MLNNFIPRSNTFFLQPNITFATIKASNDWRYWKWITFHGFPGSNSGTRSVYAAPPGCQSFPSVESLLLGSGQPLSPSREDHVPSPWPNNGFMLGLLCDWVKPPGVAGGLLVVPGARENSFDTKSPSLSSDGSFHWFNLDCCWLCCIKI